MVSQEQFKRGMRRLASGVSLVTTAFEGRFHGLAATSVSSLSASPPSLLVCVNQNASAYQAMRSSRILCVNLLKCSDQSVARRFSSSEDREKRFALGEWVPLETGAPAYVGALASFDGVVEQTIHYQSHTIFVAAIKAVKLWDADIDPLIYVNGEYGAMRGCGGVSRAAEETHAAV